MTHSFIKLSKFKILFSISQTFFIPLSRFHFHILQSTHLTQLNGRCSMSKISFHKSLVPYSFIKLSKFTILFSISHTFFYPIIQISLSHPAVNTFYTVEWAMFSLLYYIVYESNWSFTQTDFSYSWR